MTERPKDGYLVGDEDYRDRLAAIVARIPADVQADLRAAHEDWGWCCAARGEGLACCIDMLLEEGMTDDAGRHDEGRRMTG